MVMKLISMSLVALLLALLLIKSLFPATQARDFTSLFWVTEWKIQTIRNWNETTYTDCAG